MEVLGMALVQHTLTVAEAAAELGVSVSEAKRLLANGTILGRRASGGTWLVDAASVRARAEAPIGRGRPLGAETCWAVLQLLAGEDLSNVTPKLRHSARRAMFSAPAPQQMPGWLRARSQVKRFDAHVSVRRALLEDARVRPAGDAVLSHLDAAAHLLGSSDTTDVYVSATQADQLIREHGLLPATGGRVWLRLVPGSVAQRLWSPLPWTAAAVDALSSDDPRVVDVGRAALQLAFAQAQLR